MIRRIDTFFFLHFFRCFFDFISQVCHRLSSFRITKSWFNNPIWKMRDVENLFIDIIVVTFANRFFWLNFDNSNKSNRIDSIDNVFNRNNTINFYNLLINMWAINGRYASQKPMFVAEIFSFSHLNWSTFTNEESRLKSDRTLINKKAVYNLDFHRFLFYLNSKVVFSWFFFVQMFRNSSLKMIMIKMNTTHWLSTTINQK